MINKFLAKLSGRERMVVIAAVSIVAVMMLDRIVVGPIISNIGVLGVRIEEKERTLRAYARILSNEKRVKKEKELYAKYSLKALPSEDELAGLLGEIENLAREADVYLVDSSPSGTEEKGVLKMYLIKVDCNGTVDEIFRFIHSIESSRKLMNIESMRIKPAEKGSEVMKCNLSVAKTVLIKP